jgi:hypothetical protein
VSRIRYSLVLPPRVAPFRLTASRLGGHYRPMRSTGLRAAVVPFLLVCAGSTSAPATRGAPPVVKIAPAPPGAQTYRCTGSRFNLFGNSNGQATQNNAKAPTFATKGKSYCVVSLATYHWNGGQGAAPGSIGLTVVSGLGRKGQTLGPLAAVGSAGQGGAADVNWTADAGQPIVINGTYDARTPIRAPGRGTPRRAAAGSAPSP